MVTNWEFYSYSKTDYSSNLSVFTNFDHAGRNLSKMEDNFIKITIDMLALFVAITELKSFFALSTIWALNF